MSLSFYFKFNAPPSKSPEQLELFFKSLEKEARQLGFEPTLVINAKFDTDERREFARRLTTGLKLDSDALKGVVLLDERQVFTHDPVNGHCRVIPTEGVFLVVTNEKREETVFGLLRYPETLQDRNGRPIVKTGTNGSWTFQDFIDDPDSRYRKLVKIISDAGFLESATDEFAPGKNPFNLPAS